jgi:DNA-binding GntR family transcriptional regulator
MMASTKSARGEEMAATLTKVALSSPEKTMADRTLSPVDRAYNYILEGIVSGALEPGMRIPTESVADELGISRMPVRDALRRLEGDGVVTIFANRGASIAEYSYNEVIELTEMRSVLEGLAARVALDRITDVDLEQLSHLLRLMDKSRNDLTRWTSYHDDFHNYLTSLSGRPLLMQQTKRIRLMLRPYFGRYVVDTNETEIPGLEHQRIIDMIVKKDPDELERVVRAHAQVNVLKVASFAQRR